MTAAPPVDVAAALAAVRARIDAAGGALLVAVSKGQSAQAIEEAYAAGQRAFGESYAQELVAKREILDSRCPELQWHFIGRVQRNKVAVLAETALVHGVGSVDHARALGARRRAGGAHPDGRAPLPVLAQVNLGGEQAKSGFTEADLRHDLQALREVPGVALAGLMTIPPDDGHARRWFRALRALRDELLPGAALSMGMSGDYEDAVREGATWVRVGSAIFGPRAR